MVSCPTEPLRQGGYLSEKGGLKAPLGDASHPSLEKLSKSNE